MNPTLTLRCLALACCGLILTTFGGCSRWIEMTSPPVDINEQVPQVIARDEQVPLILDRIQTSKNGSPQNSSSETEQRILLEKFLLDRIVQREREDAENIS